MDMRALVAVALLACTAPRPHPPKGDLVLTVTGKVEQGPFRFGKDDLRGLPRRSFTAVAPLAKAEVRFEGIAVAKLLSDDVAIDKGADIAVFRAKSGAVAVVPLTTLRQTKPVLADEVDGAAIGRWRESAEPLQLAWPNVEQPGIDTDPRMSGWWIGGVVRVELQSWSTTFGRALRVPQGAGDEARRGAEAVATSCLGCHKLRASGGTRGQELRDLGIQRDPRTFEGRIGLHLSRLAAEGSVPVPPAGGNMARDITAFLRAVEIAGPQAEDGAQSPAPAALSPPAP